MTPPCDLKILVASHNPGKIREIRAALAGLHVSLDFLVNWPHLAEPHEDGSTFAENARLKATHYHKLTGLPTLADDSGLVVPALNGAPGVHSARFASTDQDRIRKLLDLLAHLRPPISRSAHFVCALCLCQAEGVFELQAEVAGEIATEPVGTNGFGYDPVFFYPPLAKTFAQLSLEEKNRVSHRAQALRRLRPCLEALTRDRRDKP